MRYLIAFAALFWLMSRPWRGIRAIAPYGAFAAALWLAFAPGLPLG